jgi:hypothetical protein
MSSLRAAHVMQLVTVCEIDPQGTRVSPTMVNPL